MDLRVIHLRQVLSIVRMAERPGPPHELTIVGPATDQVTEVEINGVRGYPFRVVNETTIVVTLPELLTVRSIAVLGKEMTGIKEATIFIGFTAHITSVSGLQKLVQDWLKVFFTTPGSDQFARSSGGGAQKLVGSTFASRDDMGANLTIAVRRTNSEMLRRQASDMSIPRSERLLNAEMKNLVQQPGDQSIAADVEITNHENNRVRVGLG